MSHYHFSTIVSVIIVLVINLTCALTLLSSSPSIKDKLLMKKNDTSLHTYQRASAHVNKMRNITALAHNHFRPSHEWNDAHDNDQLEKHDNEDLSTKETTANIVVITSLSGIYVWWPILLGGDDSFHLLLSQEDVPRFHDVTGDDFGHIYLTAPHERTVYRLQYSDGWWIANFSNHSLMNSIRSEMPLFVSIHRVSSILYVYGHSDIQMIDLLERSRTRGSAPFMKRLRELSPNLRISGLIIDQLTSEGYIIGDSYGWCVVIRCSLSVNECLFLFKIPTSYDNRPYPCTATIDFSSKIMYLSLEEKILGVHLNEQTNFDRRFVLTEKNGPRSTLGYDDIVTYNNTILYTDVLRPVLHICTSKDSNPCLNLSLVFPSPQRTILPLRLSVIKVRNLRPPILDEEDDHELHVNQSNISPAPLFVLIENTTKNYQHLTIDKTTITSHEYQRINLNSLWVLLLGIIIGLIIGSVSFMIYCIISKKKQPITEKKTSIASTSSSSKLLTPEQMQPSKLDRKHKNESKSKLSTQSSSSDSATNNLLELTPYSSTSGSSEWTTVTSSLSYQPDIIL
ncbi:unnamed protein product [Rotaria magnacalcarata]|uniref:Uncharacterized protein n=1 Tax=Rotaria magnacalcarata TaxID=392030 RepID=A0A818Y5K9_9BILA|nr:unnamed protein product [Rotaria magnacalcarata]CAF3750054.1 unnamed protein product [Rotaria magnacalcarata]